MRGEEVFGWRERGDSVTVETTLEGALVVTVDNDGRSATATLVTSAAGELLGELVAHLGYADLENAQEDLAATYSALEVAEAEAREYRDQLIEVRSQVEQLKSALDIADRRARGYERDVERMRSAMSALPDPVQS